MIGQCEVVADGDLFLQHFDGFVLKFFYSATLGADHVVVMFAPVEFEYGVAAFEVVALNQACGFELGQYPVDGGQTDFLALGNEASVDLFGRKMAFSRFPSFEDFEDLDTRQGDLETRVSYVFGFQNDSPAQCVQLTYRVSFIPSLLGLGFINHAVFSYLVGLESGSASCRLLP
jgi:hypothetical protein